MWITWLRQSDAFSLLMGVIWRHTTIINTPPWRISIMIFAPSLLCHMFIYFLSLSLFSSFINRWENQLHINWSANCDTKTRFYFFVSFSLNQYLFIRFVRCYWIFNRKQTMAPCRYKNCFRNEKKINIVNQEFFSFEYS